MESQRLAMDLLLRGHTSSGTREQRIMRLRTLSPYEYRCRNLHKALCHLYNQYVNFYIAGRDTRFLEASIRAYCRILKTDPPLLRRR
jgi:hypothetical protein